MVVVTVVVTVAVLEDAMMARTSAGVETVDDPTPKSFALQPPTSSGSKDGSSRRGDHGCDEDGDGTTLLQSESYCCP